VIDAGLAADRAVDHREQRRRRHDERHAAEVRGGRESGEIADDTYAKIKDYVKKEKVPYTILIDKKNVVADRFDAQTTPHIFVIDDKGKLRYAGGVDDDETFKKDAKAVKSFVRDALDAVLAGKEPPQATTKPHGCSIKRVGAKS